MADNEQKYPLKHTALGDYLEVQPGVHVSASVNLNDLVVPAEASQTGQAHQLPMQANTVIFTSADSERFKQVSSAAIDAEKAGDPTKLADMKSALSLVTEWTKATTTAASPVSTQIVKTYLNREDDGFRAFKVSEDGAMARLSSDPASQLIGAAGVANSSELNVIPEAYAKAFSTWATDHELHHLQGKILKQDLGEEIRADFGSLTEHFNKPFTDFAMDIRALGALNISRDEDHHSTHIWAEEYKDGMPTDAQATAIDLAPGLIQKRAAELMSKGSDWTPQQALDNLQSTAGRYAAYKALNDNHAFDDIPYGKEFIDKYLVAADRRYSDTVKSEAASVQASYNEVAQEACKDMVPAAAVRSASVAPQVAPAL